MRATPGWARAAAGPALIIVSVMAVLHGFWLHPKLTNQQVDLLAFWLPRYCAMGKAVAAGHVATWLPNQFGGVPFASDPQSGWLYLPAMVLFSTVSCARALGLTVVLQPLLAGLGLFWFLRHEGLGRPASTAGGLTLALAMSDSSVALSLPFAGTLAWTAIALAGASGFLMDRRPARMIGWVGLTAFAWSQLAGAHLTHGLLMGTMVVALYVLARSMVQVRAKERSGRVAALLAAGMFVALPVLSAAVLIPRLALLPRTSIGQGYQALGRLATTLSGTPNAPPFAERGIGGWWITSFGRGPGGYIGVLAIVLLPFAFRSKRWRAPAVAFAAAGLVGFVLNLDALVRTSWIRNAALKLGVGELWLRSPYRFRYLLLLSFAALAGYGLQAWLDRGPAAARRGLRWIGATAALFVLLPHVGGGTLASHAMIAIGLVWAVPLLFWAARGAGWAAMALPGFVAAELVVAGLIAQTGPISAEAGPTLETVSSTGLGHSFADFHTPFIDPSTYLTPGPIGDALIRGRGSYGRYLSFAPTVSVGAIRGFLSHQQPEDWPAQENGRSILFGLEEVQGYSPVQVLRYWELVRKLDPHPIYYNSASFQALDPSVLRLFGVEWLIARDDFPAPADAKRITTDGPYVLYRLTDAQPRASVVLAFGKATSPEAALTAVTDPSFDPSRVAFLEADPPQPGFGTGPEGSATYQEVTPEDVRVEVTASRPAMVVIRNAWDHNWRATVDGEPVPVERVDYLLQGIRIPAGVHEVRLAYVDEAIGGGLWTSAIAWAVLAALAALLWLRGRAGAVATPA